MENKQFELSGNIVDIIGRRIVKGMITFSQGKIDKIEALEKCPDVFILPGLVDAHVHIESSMLIPQQFARIAVKHGTVAAISDPHEIANVLGIEGINFMLDDASNVPFKFFFGVPSCVPATSFETSGAVLNADEIDKLLQRNDLFYLSEMMNFPGVVYDDKEVLNKINSAKKLNKPIDGHAPGLSGDSLKKYAGAGISTDHECTSLSEAIEKINCGMKILIREGSAAKNFDALIPLIKDFPDEIMLCTDDCHPDDLIEKHILDLIKRGLKAGYNMYDLLRAANLNPKKHFKLEIGSLQVGDSADFFVVDNMEDLHVQSTFINGEKVYDKGKFLMQNKQTVTKNKFECVPISIDDILLQDVGKMVKTILVNDGELYTGMELVLPKVLDNQIVSDIDRDVLKVIVLNRYRISKPVIGLIKNFNLKKGAIACSISHDSHNIISVGVSDEDIIGAINDVIRLKGGIVAKWNQEIYSLPLPIAGLMSDEKAEVVAEKYKLISQKPKDWGCTLNSPFMTLSFMALLVIPELKIGDKGLFDGKDFKLTSLFA